MFFLRGEKRPGNMFSSKKNASHAKWHEQFVSFHELFELAKDNSNQKLFGTFVFFFFGKGKNKTKWKNFLSCCDFCFFLQKSFYKRQNFKFLLLQRLGKNVPFLVI